MMTCHQITRSVSDFLERRLKLRDRMAFLLHIAMCRGCRAYVEQFRLALVGLHAFGELADATNPPSESLLERFREETRSKDN